MALNPVINPRLERGILIECKNYKAAVDVTYIGKFYSLLKVSKQNAGILVAWKGVTGGTDWKNGYGLIRKIALRDNLYIIVLDKNDLKVVVNQQLSIFKLLNKKIEELDLDVKFDSGFTQQHELLEKFKDDNG